MVAGSNPHYALFKNEMVRAELLTIKPEFAKYVDLRTVHFVEFDSVHAIYTFNPSLAEVCAVDRVNMTISVVKIFLVLALVFVSCAIEASIRRDIDVGGRRRLSGSSGLKVFDVTKYGAKADGKSDSTMAFMKTWVDACKTNTQPGKVLVPKGTFVTSPVVFQGPCKSSVPITVEVQGTIKASTDLSKFSEDFWFSFEKITGLVLTGGGTFDGQGASAWKYNNCKKGGDCNRLPTSIKFEGVTNSIISGISSINSKFFHFHISDCTNFTATDLKITAPGDSPNTDGMHLSNTNGVNVSKITVGTGDDCISIGSGVTHASFSHITCGPGHGISVGSLGKYQHEKDVNGIVISDCTLSKTTNGLRIKTWPGSPPSAASGITFQNITMNSVQNPIIIDQKYGSSSSTPSRVKISDIHFKNIKGTSASDVAVSLTCSSSFPCQGIQLANVDLTYNGGEGKASCLNAKVTSSGAPSCK
ncbi:exopolygalacturonase-like [Mercurialis annua]|uniref:exopolygalacturonase-like n=1 Tax=Mercurialis annua TaxID=3986 RepID=UPI00215FA9DC|nr:exopolygalacturonase-like [Mercurialis annua]